MVTCLLANRRSIAQSGCRFFAIQPLSVWLMTPINLRLVLIKILLGVPNEKLRQVADGCQSWETTISNRYLSVKNFNWDSERIYLKPSVWLVILAGRYIVKMSSFQESKIETNVHTLVNKKPRKLGMVLLTFKGHVDSNFLVNHRHISIIERHISHHYVFLNVWHLTTRQFCFNIYSFQRDRGSELDKHSA